MAKYNDGDPASEAWEIANSARFSESHDLSVVFRRLGGAIALPAVPLLVVILLISGRGSLKGNTETLSLPILFSTIPVAALAAAMAMLAFDAYLELRAWSHDWRFTRELFRRVREFSVPRKFLLADALALQRRIEAGRDGRTDEEIQTAARMDECTRLVLVIRRWGILSVILGVVGLIVAAWIVRPGGLTANTDIPAYIIYVIPFMVLVGGVAYIAVAPYLKARATRYRRQLEGELDPRLEES